MISDHGYHWIKTKDQISCWDNLTESASVISCFFSQDSIHIYGKWKNKTLVALWYLQGYSEPTVSC